jgi:hypothetical protein
MRFLFCEYNACRLTVHILESVIQSGLTGRRGVVFEPLFNFVYRDTHLMLTVGGMIALEEDSRRIEGSGLSHPSAEVPYVRRKLRDSPYRIPNLKLTRKERLFLDGTVPHGSLEPPKFHLNREILSQYNEVYRFFPAYAELLI